jgi:hypothetical protein
MQPLHREMHPFRFELQIRPTSAEGLRSLPLAAEDAGFDVTHTWDHVGEDWAPLAPVIAIRRVPNKSPRNIERNWLTTSARTSCPSRQSCGLGRALAFGSDAPVDWPDPIHWVRAALARLGRQS